MNVEIRDELVTRLREAEKRCDDSLGSIAKARAEQVLGEVVDQIVRDVVQAIRAMSIKEKDKS